MLMISMIVLSTMIVQLITIQPIIIQYLAHHHLSTLMLDGKAYKNIPVNRNIDKYISHGQGIVMMGDLVCVKIVVINL